MTDKRWKAQERLVARALGGERQPNTGRRAADVLAGPYAVEVKTRRKLPEWLTDAMAQAEDSARGRTPLVVLVEVRQGVRARRLAVLWLDDLPGICTRGDGSASQGAQQG